MAIKKSELYSSLSSSLPEQVKVDTVVLVGDAVKLVCELECDRGH